jgi:hypothetical protein
MSSKGGSSKKVKKRSSKSKLSSKPQTMPGSRQGFSSTLEGSPMLPRTARGADYELDELHASGGANGKLLDEKGRLRAQAGVGESDEELGGERSKRPLSPRDKRAMALLILLCAYIA